MGPAKDGIGIHPSVAHTLSGADFDGDTVVVIPNNSGKVKSKQPLTELESFDPKAAYPSSPGMTKMTKANTQKEMGRISNLITDMTIKGAKTSEIARAVKHSMVVIDAEKHELNYKLAEKDLGIAQLKTAYQSDPKNPRKSGASTIISRAGSEKRIPQVRERRKNEIDTVTGEKVRTPGKIDPKTGEVVYVPTGKTYTKTVKDPVTGKYVPVTERDPVTGKQVPVVVPKETKFPEMKIVKDARKLSSGEPIEEVYANYANSMKALANTARKSAVAIPDPKQSQAAKMYYAKEVSSLKAKLKNAQMNAPLERRAQIIAGATAKARIATRSDLDKDDIKKIKYESLRDARNLTGAAKERIGSKLNPLEQREWDAIQSGAVATTTLRKILENADIDVVKQLATPRYRSSLTPGQIALAKTMSNSGRSLSEIANALGIPRSTIADNLARGG
jgi:DNA-binding CsgD family transcriptional regulator